jgi:hypothetical protein
LTRRRLAVNVTTRRRREPGCDDQHDGSGDLVDGCEDFAGHRSDRAPVSDTAAAITQGRGRHRRRRRDLAVSFQSARFATR